MSLLFDFCEAILIQRILFIKSAFHFQVLSMRRLLLFFATHWFRLFYQDRWILFPGKTWQKRNSHTTSLFYLHTDSIRVWSNYCSAQNWAVKSCTVPQEISCGLNIFSKLMFRPVFPYCTYKNKVHRDDSNRYTIARSPFFQFALVFYRLNKERWVWPENMSRHTCFAVMVQYQRDTSKLFWSHHMTGGRKCCLNVIPAGSFSLSLPLPPPSFFFSFSQFSRKWACSQASTTIIL